MPDLNLHIVATDAEQLLKSILTELTEEQLDEVQVEREFEQQDDLVAEPVTVGFALITVTAPLAYAIVRLVEKHLENIRQKEALIEIRTAPAAAREYLARIAESNNRVTIKFGQPVPPGANSPISE
jgi:hypothetical protein